MKFLLIIGFLLVIAIFLMLCYILFPLIKEKYQKKQVSVIKSSLSSDQQNIIPEYLLRERLNEVNHIPWYAYRIPSVVVSNTKNEVNYKKSKWDTFNFDDSPKDQFGNPIVENVTTIVKEKITKVISILEDILVLKSYPDETYILNYITSKSDLESISNESILFAILHFNKMLVHYSAESQVLPINYKKIIETYSLNSHSKFIPTHFCQANESSDKVEFVQFKCMKKVYNFFPDNNDDYVDEQIVSAAINLALFNNGIEERFYDVINSDLQCISIFLTPKEMVSLLQKFNFKIK